MYLEYRVSEICTVVLFLFIRYTLETSMVSTNVTTDTHFDDAIIRMSDCLVMVDNYTGP